LKSQLGRQHSLGALRSYYAHSQQPLIQLERNKTGNWGKIRVS
jgi:hypothetical protein